MPLGGRDYVIVCKRSAIPFLGHILGPQNLGAINRIVVLDHAGDTPESVTLGLDDSRKATIRVSGAGYLRDCLHCEIILFNHEYDYGVFLQGHRLLHSVGFATFFVAMPYLYDSGFKTTHRPDYLSRHRAELEEVLGLLADEESRQVFAARIRALLTGNVGYLRLARYPQYFHPQALPREGDVVLDGGVSQYVEEQIEIASAVGPGGRLFGFEPDPEGFCAAHDRLAQHPACANYTLLPCGLWNRKEKVRFNPAGVGSGVAGDGGIEVQMTSVDTLVRELSLPRVDFIKLDVEGSEFQALRGALKTLVRFRPRLAVSAYHKFEDLYELPLLIKQILPDYRLFLGHHHPALFDTVLYACPA